MIPLLARRARPHRFLLTGALLLLVSACGEGTDADGDSPRTSVQAAPDPAEVSVEIQDQYAREISALAQDPRVEAAFQRIEELEDWTMENLITITEIPAPPFMEDERGAAYLEMLREVGVDEAYRDEEGNIIGVRRGTEGGRVLVVSAHLDTVFPEGTDVTVQFRGDTLYAPGVGDDSRGLAVVLTLLRTMNEVDLQTRGDVWFVGTVGEEGLGDLRGVKHLFREGGPDIDAFISIDGSGLEGVTNAALGSRRYRVTVRGEGGHSWGAFGIGNPAHALGRAIRRFDEVAADFVSEGPRTSYNVGRIGGGTSVNSVPFESWMEVDMRSLSQESLRELDRLFVATMEEAVAEQNERRLDGAPLILDMEQVGDRPSGEISPQDPFVQRAMAAVAHFGAEPQLGRSSTDANVSISLGIPSVTIGGGGVGAGAHSLDEWWMNEDGHLAIQRTLLLVLADAGLVEDEG
ncbi:MAG: M20/M25/M40 family metallo-hydrolase [Gemmatimonadales bacterium]|nr:MAG: M20/M25/M40 family metallo-hydrolase [Gemmatimonadales bacterium]